MSSSNIRRRNQDEEDAPETAVDKASRIAANTAKFESTPAASMLRTPLQWKGYGWRFMRGFNDTASSGDLNSTNSSNNNNSNNNPASTSTSDSNSWKQWAVTGVKKRSCRVMCTVFLVLAVVILCFAFAFASVYGWAVSTDPCMASRNAAQFLVDHPRKSAHPFTVNVPKIIHQQWKTNTIPAGVYTKWSQKFKELYPEPEYTHMLWTDENAREMIARDFPFFLSAYDGYEFGIQRADAARYFVLYKYGGLYADLDYEPLRNFWEHLPKDRVALVESPYLYNEKSQNSLMSSPARDPFWNETFSLLLARKDKPVLQATGPMFLDALMKTATEDFVLLPCENFQRLPLHLSSAEEVSPFMSQLHREVLGRIAPMKYCGDYHNNECQYGKHHNTASYLPDTGVLKLLWTR